MTTKLEAGKTYRLINELAYIASHKTNENILKSCATKIDGEYYFTLTSVDLEDQDYGYIGGVIVIAPEELSLFELADNDTVADVGETLDKLKEMTLVQIAVLMVENGWEV